MPGDVLWIAAVHLALTAAPGVAAVLFAVRQGGRDVPVLLCVGLAASGVAAMVAFWSYLPGQFLGHSVAYGIFFGSVGTIAWCVPAVRGEARLLRELATPLALWALAALFVLSLGFLHGGAEDPLGMAAARFTSPLPPDNVIPTYFADWFFENGYGGGPMPFPGDWLSSDRPPLQIGYVLAQRIFAWDTTGMHYQVLGVLLQQLWVVGLWALLCAARATPKTRALVMVAVLAGDIAIVHGFFVWPKLLGAAFVFAAAALLISPRWAALRRDPRVVALLASLTALALLAHGAGIFGLLPLAALAAFRGLPDWRRIGVGALVGALLLAPWSAYQSFGDPPGNRLMKWHLGGVPALDERGTLETIVDSYREAGVVKSLENKGENFLAIVGGPHAADSGSAAAGDLAAGDLEAAVRGARSIRFFNPLPLLGFLVVVPVLMVVGRRRGRKNAADWRVAIACFTLAGLGLLLWGLLVFGSEEARTTTHEGSMALPILVLCAAVAGARATYPRLALVLVALNVLVALALYVPSFDPPQGTSYSAFAALTALASLAAFCALALRPVRSDPVREHA